MPKRFTETTKWGDRWFYSLPNEQRLAYLYLLDNCDAAGVVDVPADLVDHIVRGQRALITLEDLAGDRLVRLPCGKLWLTRFIDFQYGGWEKLSETCAPHKPVMQSIARYRLNEFRETLSEGFLVTLSEGLQDKEKDKDKSLPLGKDKGAGEKATTKRGKRFVPPTVEEVRAYCEERQNGIDAQALVDHYAANGWMRGKSQIRDWKACVRTWESKQRADKDNSIQF